MHVRGRVRGLVTAVLVGATVACALVVAVASPAWAHGKLLGSVPANGAQLDEAPAQVSLRFSEHVTLVRGGIRVLGADGRPVPGVGDAMVDAAQPDMVRVPLPSGLGDGIYTLAWRVVSADSHPIQGVFAFSVGEVHGAAVVPSETGTATGGTNRAVAVVFAVVRWLGYAGIVVLLGGLLFVLACWRVGWARRRTRQLVGAGWVASLVAAVAALLLQGPYAAGTSLAGMVDGGLIAATLGTGYGIGLLVRIGLLLLLGALLVWLTGRDLARLPRPRLTVPAGVLGVAGVAVLATWPATGHAHVGRQAAAGYAADLLHLVAVVAWLGGLTVLASCLLPATRDRFWRPDAATAVGRFSRLALVCVAVLVGTGSYQAWRQVGGWAPFVETTYGRLLLAKITAVAVIIGFAAASRSLVHHRPILRTLPVLHRLPALLPAVARLPVLGRVRRPAMLPAGVSSAPPRADVAVDPGGDGHAAGLGDRSGPGGQDRPDMWDESDDEAPARRRFRRSVTAEFALAAVVLGLTAVLVATSPASEAAMGDMGAGTGQMGGTSGGGGMSGNEPAGPYTTSLPRPAGGTVDVRLAPASTGQNELTVTVRDPAGSTVRVPEVTANMTLRTRGLGPLPVHLAQHKHGVFTGTVTVPLSGQWRLDISVRTTAFDEHTLTTEVPIG